MRMYLRVRAQFIHLPGASISLSRPGPRPCSTNDMKGSPSVRIACSKASLMFENGDGCLWKEGLQVYQCQGRGKYWHVSWWVLFWLLSSVRSVTRRHIGLACTRTSTDRGWPQSSNSWPLNLYFWRENRLAQHHEQIKWVFYDFLREKSVWRLQCKPTVAFFFPWGHYRRITLSLSD